MWWPTVHNLCVCVWSTVLAQISLWFQCLNCFYSSVFWPKVLSRITHCPYSTVPSTPKPWGPVFLWLLLPGHLKRTGRLPWKMSVHDLFNSWVSNTYQAGCVSKSPETGWKLRNPHAALLQWAWPMHPFSDPQVFYYIPKTEDHRSGNVPTVGILQKYCCALQDVSQEANSTSTSHLELNWCLLGFSTVKLPCPLIINKSPGVDTWRRFVLFPHSPGQPSVTFPQAVDNVITFDGDFEFWHLQPSAKGQLFLLLHLYHFKYF